MNPLILVLSFALFAPHVASASSTYGPEALWAAEEVSTPRRIAKGKKKGKRNAAKREQRRAKVEKKIRTFLVVELTDALELSDDQQSNWQTRLKKRRASSTGCGKKRTST